MKSFKDFIIEGQKPYVSSTSPDQGRKGSHDVLNHKGEVDKSFEHSSAGMKAAQHHLKTHWERLSGRVNEEHIEEGSKMLNKGPREIGDVEHVHGDHAKLDKEGIATHDRDDYGQTHHVTLHTGHKVSVYQSGHHQGRPIISVRSLGKPVPKHIKKSYMKKLGDIME